MFFQIQSYQLGLFGYSQADQCVDCAEDQPHRHRGESEAGQDAQGLTPPP